MQDGFLKVAVTTPELKVADCLFNKEQMVKKAKEMDKKGVRLLVFPELSLTGCTCGDLFLHDTLLNGAQEALLQYAKETSQLDIVSVLGMPFSYKGSLYNVAVVVDHGNIRGIVPKTYLSNTRVSEAKYFSSGFGEIEWCLLMNGEAVPFGSNQVFVDNRREDICFGIEIGEDIGALNPPSTKLVGANALIMVNLSASNEIIGRTNYCRELIKTQSAKVVAAYLYANAGEGESTTDFVFAGYNLIASNGKILSEGKPFANDKDLITEIDLECLKNERRRKGSYFSAEKTPILQNSCEFAENKETKLTRIYNKTPFVPEDEEKRNQRCCEILDIQANGLAKRLKHTSCESAVVGLSGGLDSTLALLVTVRAFELLGLDKKGIVCVTMPCFGTTYRTYENALALSKELGTSMREISIKASVLTHFDDIGHERDLQDITYENAQARERTQILMDVANQINAMVIGTGDMSELALGWATYNGDHMSMYGVNSCVPKTLVRYLVKYCADKTESKQLHSTLYDILDTPVSPELLPPQDGEIVQKTEDIVGPYELHDFFLYYMLRYGYAPKKIFRLAVHAFGDEYSKQTIHSWLSTFCHRFFRQQFKRSCLPDGPKVGMVSLSPRGDFNMPSDACDTLWKAELESIRKSLI